MPNLTWGAVYIVLITEGNIMASDTPETFMPPSPEIDMPPLSKDDKDAIRAYLGRAEVRHSTLHRIAIGFISGAGLLLLFPIFFRDIITIILTTLLNETWNHFPTWGTNGTILTLALMLSVGIPFMISVFIPIYALYLLLKDIVHFYFSVYTPGFSPELNNPTFSLTGMAFPLDESETVKKAVYAYQYRHHDHHFLMAFSEGRKRDYLDSFIQQTGGKVIPESRQRHKLAKMGITSHEVDPTEVNRLNAMFGLARLTDRTLIEEVAYVEMVMTRSIIYLRRIVIRYIKTLLVFIWTALISFVMAPFLSDDRFPPLLVLAIGYFIWSFWAQYVIHLPVMWMYKFDKELGKNANIDRQILVLEARVRRWIWSAMIASAVALILSIASIIV
jgi:hypothetical protein